MLIIKERADITSDYNIQKICNPEKIIYFDIETTGFSRKYNVVYLIGCMYFENNELYFTQYMTENPKEEAIILQEFYKKLSSYDTIIHFNGAAFDMPFLRERGEKYGISFDFDKYNSIDLYKKLKPYAHILKLENLKQKTVEKLFKIKRQDPFSGGELIEVYNEYVKTKDERLLKALLMHNMEDVFYMGRLTSILAFTDFFDGAYTISSYDFTTYTDINGNAQKELVIVLELTNPLLFSISYKKEDAYLTGKQNKVHLSVKVLTGELKYFFPNYKDYYYLPEEDMAMHKSVATYVDKNHRKNATPATCYIKKWGEFLSITTSDTSQFGEVFNKEYKDKTYYVLADKINEDNLDGYLKIKLKGL